MGHCSNNRFCAFARIAAAMVLFVFVGISAARAGGTDWQAGVPKSGVLHFDVFVAGSRDGYHTMTFLREGQDLVVHTEVKIRVRLMFVTVFDYRQSIQERWRDGRLIRFESRTQDGDTVDSVSGQATADGFQVSSERFGDRMMPADILPSSAFWRRDSVSRKRFLDAARGDYRDVSIREIGWENTDQAGKAAFLQRYHVDSSRDFDVWYDANGQWQRLEWSGFGMTAEYVRRASVIN